ncbi:MAG: PIN domain-containing protein [Gemmataceae bacterium]|nr:PIN domain-containing protein [Gemmataceae bacterium]
MTLIDRIAPGSLIALDTMVWIYAFESHPRYAPVVRIVFDEMLAPGRNRIGSSILTLGEVLVRPLALGRVDIAIEYRRAIQSGSGLEVWEIHRAIVEKAAQLRADHRLRMVDSLHVSSAMVHRANCFLTNDAAFKKVTGIEVLLLDEYLSQGSDEPPVLAIRSVS